MSEILARRWPLFLLVSLGLNCLLIGLIVGHVTEAAAPSPPPQASQPVQIAGFGARVLALSEADKRGFAVEMRPFRADIRTARRELATARQALADAFARQPYDPAATKEAFTVVRHREQTVQELVQNAAAQALGAVSAEGRRQLVK
jgi:uncharacterized membrane protein